MNRRLPGPVSEIRGSFEVPTSKSLTNRALIAAAAADGGTIHRPLDCEDTRLLAEALARAGWPVGWERDVTIGRRRPVDHATVDLGNSGTGARLVLGLLACIPGRFRIDGTNRLRERPMSPLIEALSDLGSEIRSRDGFLPVEIIGGDVAGGSVQIRPEVSSQFVSALLLAGPLMADGIDLHVVGPMPSRPYLELTREVMEAFGASIDAASPNRWRVRSGGYRQTDYPVEGDWSAAAFAGAAVAVVGGRVTIHPLTPTSSQGDRFLLEVLRRAGLEIGFSGENLEISGRMTQPFEADLTDTPDLFPALAVVAASGPVGSVLDGLEHLKHKESDRLSVMIENLGRLGARFERRSSSIRVLESLGHLDCGPIHVTAADDHRIAMAMAVAALAVGELDLDDDRCVAKSFPAFWGMWDGFVQGAGSRL